MLSRRRKVQIAPHLATQIAASETDTTIRWQELKISPVRFFILISQLETLLKEFFSKFFFFVGQKNYQLKIIFIEIMNILQN